MILIEDGVYAAIPDTNKSTLIENVIRKNNIYALTADLEARGIEKIMPSIQQADYETFIDLIEAQPTQSWL